MKTINHRVIEQVAIRMKMGLCEHGLSDINNVINAMNIIIVTKQYLIDKIVKSNLSYEIIA